MLHAWLGLTANQAYGTPSTTHRTTASVRQALGHCFASLASTLNGPRQAGDEQGSTWRYCRKDPHSVCYQIAFANVPAPDGQASAGLDCGNIAFISRRFA